MTRRMNMFKSITFVLLLLFSITLVACDNGDAKKAAQFDELVDALPEVITLEDESAILDAFDAYDALTDDQKELTKKYEDLLAKESQLKRLKEIAAVEESISKLPAELTLAHKSLVEKAREAFNKLTNDQQAKVSNLNILEAKEAKIVELEEDKADQEIANGVIELINSLPRVIALEDQEDIEAARTAFDALTENQQAKVSNYEKLEAAEEALDVLIAEKIDQENKEAALQVMLLITALPSKLKLTDKTAVEAARAAYEALTSEQKVFVTTLSLLEDKEVQIANLELAEPVIQTIASLPEEVLISDEGRINQARAQYDALEDHIKKLVSNYDILLEKEDQLLAKKNPDLHLLKTLAGQIPSQIISDFMLPNEDDKVTWSYKEGEDDSLYDIETGELLKTTFGKAYSVLVGKLGDAQIEVSVNFGLVNEGQTAIFYTGDKKLGEVDTKDGGGTYESQLEVTGFSGFMIVVGDKVYFLAKNSYIPISGTEENEEISREQLRPHGLEADTEVNNIGFKAGKPVGYGGAAALYYNDGDVAVTFDASNTYGRTNVQTGGFGKVRFIPQEDGTFKVDQATGEHGDGNATGPTGILTFTLNPGEYLLTPHGYDVDYGNVGSGTKLIQGNSGVLAPDTIIQVLKFKYIEIA